MAKITQHAKKRILERFGKYDVESLSNGARHSGLKEHDLLEVPNLLEYYRKKAHTGKKVYIYSGFVFIYFSTSKRMITMYPLPDEYKEDYEKVAYKEAEKQESYRRSKREQQQ